VLDDKDSESESALDISKNVNIMYMNGVFRLLVCTWSSL